MNKISSAALAASLVLTACGGGGGNTATSSTPAQAQSIVTHGTITGFGSVIVQGVHYDTSKAEFELDGSGGKRQDDLSVGQRVTIVGRVDDRGNHLADRVEYEAELHGSVTAIDLAAQRFTALGQTIVVDDATVYRGLTDLSGLAVGDAIEVSGSRAADQSILASFVKKEDARAEAELKGSISALDSSARRFSIGSQTIDYANATVLPAGFTPANGATVEVKGRLQSGIVIASRVQQDDDLGSGRSAGVAAELEGLVSGLAADRGSFMIDATRVVVSSATRYEGGSQSTLADGQKLEVKGAVQADGSVAASKIEFKQGGFAAGGAKGSLDGSITQIDAAAKTITVLGVVVSTADATVYRDKRDDLRTFGFANLVVGDYVEVAFSKAGSVLTASKLERQRPDSRSLIKSTVDRFNEATASIVIAGVQVDSSAARYQINEAQVSSTEFFAALQVGAKVKAKGSFSGSTLSATEVELDQDD